MNREEYRKIEREYYDKVMFDFEKELREKTKNWDREKLLEAYIDTEKARMIIAPFPPYGWLKRVEEEDK